MRNSKGADQLHGNCAADKHLFSQHIKHNSFTYFLNPINLASSHLLLLYSLVCVLPGQIPQRQFSHDADHIILCSPNRMCRYCCTCAQCLFWVYSLESSPKCKDQHHHWLSGHKMSAYLSHMVIHQLNVFRFNTFVAIFRLEQGSSYSLVDVTGLPTFSFQSIIPRLVRKK